MGRGGATDGDVSKETTPLAAGDSIKDQRDAYESAVESEWKPKNIIQS